MTGLVTLKKNTPYPLSWDWWTRKGFGELKVCESFPHYRIEKQFYEWGQIRQLIQQQLIAWTPFVHWYTLQLVLAFTFFLNLPTRLKRSKTQNHKPFIEKHSLFPRKFDIRLDWVSLWFRNFWRQASATNSKAWRMAAFTDSYCRFSSTGSTAISAWAYP